MQVAAWRAMSPGDKLDLVCLMRDRFTTLTSASIRAARPALTDGEVRHELWRRQWGATLADELDRWMSGR